MIKFRKFPEGIKLGPEDCPDVSPEIDDHSIRVGCIEALESAAVVRPRRCAVEPIHDSGPAHTRAAGSGGLRRRAHSTALPETPMWIRAALQLQQTAGNAATTSAIARARPASKGSTRARWPTVQRFDTDEHEWLGRIASSGQTVPLAGGYRLSYGEMVAMAGDFFASLQQMRTLAAKPGPGPGTRDELEFVRRVKVHGEKPPEYDQEWIPDGMSVKRNPSYQAKVAAEARYYALAGRNQSHFLNPRGAGGILADPDTALRIADLIAVLGLSPAEILTGAAANYRNHHVTALRDAVVAGQSTGTVDDAMASEAFAGHFLTDAFSSGHVRTERTNISEHWGPRVPLFGVKLEGYIAEQLAEDLQRNAYSWRIGGYRLAVREDVLYQVALGKVREALSSKGSFGFADLVAGALHDYENQHGVPVAAQTDTGLQVVTLKGDEHLGEGAERELAVRAVRLGIGEVQAAYRLGAAGKTLQTAIGSLVVDGRFAAERAMPVALPDSYGEPDQNRIRWDHERVEDLLGDPRFGDALKVFFTAKSAELQSATADLDEAQSAAFERKVLDPLKKDPVALIRAALAWTPSTGGGFAGHNTDDNALDFVESATAAGGLATLTQAERRKLISDLLDGATVGTDEDAIMSLLRTAPEGDRRALIDEFGWDRLHDEIDDLLGEEFAESYPAARYGAGT